MTVALAFKAFAKAIPCLTPFLATSDPSVLKRILAYIRGLPCSSNISLKSDASLCGPIVTANRDVLPSSSIYKYAPWHSSSGHTAFAADPPRRGQCRERHRRHPGAVGQEAARDQPAAFRSCERREAEQFADARINDARPEMKEAASFLAAICFTRLHVHLADARDFLRSSILLDALHINAVAV